MSNREKIYKELQNLLSDSVFLTLSYILVPLMLVGILLILKGMIQVYGNYSVLPFYLIVGGYFVKKIF